MKQPLRRRLKKITIMKEKNSNRYSYNSEQVTELKINITDKETGSITISYA